jgi:hypothetical protein
MWNSFVIHFIFSFVHVAMKSGAAHVLVDISIAVVWWLVAVWAINRLMRSLEGLAAKRFQLICQNLPVSFHHFGVVVVILLSAGCCLVADMDLFF